jgi:hypothetical protein
MTPRGPLKKLLTDEQEKGFKGEKELSDVGRRQINKVARDKLEFYLKSAPDVLLILERLPDLIANLPESEREKFKSPEYLASLLDVVDKYLEFVDPWPIGETEEGDLLSIRTFAQRSGEPGKCWVESRHMDALPEEIALWVKLKNHAARLQHFIDPYLISPNYPTEDDREWYERERSRRQFVTGTTYFTRWRDEKGIRLAAPVLEDEEEVKRHKRSNPKPLPVKYEVAEDQRSVPPSEE